MYTYPTQGNSKTVLLAVVHKVIKQLMYSQFSKNCQS